MSDFQMNVLIVDDQDEIVQGVSRIVELMGYRATTASSAEDALAVALEDEPDLVVTDLNLPGRNGIELLSMLQEASIEATCIVLTGYGTIESAIEATRQGAYDYLTKPVRPKELEVVIRKAAERATLRKEVQLLRSEMERSGRFQELVGQSPAMLKLYRTIEQVGPAEASVLICGESGTGKELVARAIHASSSRSGQRLVAVNCAAIPGELLESEMFGHEKGAFTGAVQMRKGCFELAHGGTLFLDEIGDMPAQLQSKLLRVLETSSFRRVGGERDLHVDIRLISATNVHPDQLQRSDVFRQDLFFRLNVFQILLPPLRERREDIALLAERFSQQIAADEHCDPPLFSDEALELMRSYAWPGNVRELRNVVHRLTVLNAGREVKAAHLPPQIRPQIELSKDESGTLKLPIGMSIAEAERALILSTLDACAGNKTQAAAQLGISTKTLYTKLRRYGRHGDSEAEAR